MANLTPFRKNTNLEKAAIHFREFMNSFFNNDFFEQALNPSFFNFSATDIKETDNEYIIEAEMPGFDKDELEITLHDNKLIISADHKEIVEEKNRYLKRERSYGSIRRSYQLEAVDEEKIRAKYENGILKITLPKTSPDRNTTSIKID